MGATDKPAVDKYTREQVAAAPNLMVYKGKVVNAGSFKKEHPGGPAYLDRWTGKDVTEVFGDSSPHRHSAYAESVMESLVVGEILGAEQYVATAKKYEGLVDVDKPFIPQMWALGENYPGWMASQPVVRKLIIFPFAALEGMSRYPWWYVLVAIPPIIAYGMILALYQNSVPPAQALVLFGIGLFTWCLAEYLLHRWVFHLEAGTPASNIFHFFAHGLHHLTPYDETRLTFPPYFTAVLAYMFWNFFMVVSLNHPGHSAMFGGFASGYLAYDVTHFLYHHSDCKSYGNYEFPKFFASYLQCMKSHHNVHHYLNDSCNFGVSSPLLDYAFGTYLSKQDAERARE
ncbi:Ceramide very long chain fatty acid hydroxylase SCS7 [Diplonema papillatum]|nr:Ceramide very long chain fatty acid hydroxylase SCS7 [Diplonema papillatum]